VRFFAVGRQNTLGPGTDAASVDAQRFVHRVLQCGEDARLLRVAELGCWGSMERKTGLRLRELCRFRGPTVGQASFRSVTSVSVISRLDADGGCCGAGRCGCMRRAGSATTCRRTTTSRNTWRRTWRPPASRAGKAVRSSARRRARRSSSPNGATQPEAYLMIRRRAGGAGIKTLIGCHTFRATGAIKG